MKDKAIDFLSIIAFLAWMFCILFLFFSEAYGYIVLALILQYLLYKLLNSLD